VSSERQLNLREKIDEVEKVANLSRLNRFLYHPGRYLFAQFYRRIIYGWLRKKYRVSTSTFFGEKIKIDLPSSTDIYLTGGKSHSSEIRLVRFLLQYLDTDDHFLDIGAHIGYFSLIASKIVGIKGKVLSFEPSAQTFDLLQINTNDKSNIDIFKCAVSDSMGEMEFYEFPSMYSEYNTRNVGQFENEAWIQKYKPKRVKVASTTINNICQGNFHPKIIKIDVEGGEYQVIKGALDYLDYHNPIIVMEYVSEVRSNEAHRLAARLLLTKNYTPSIIDGYGSLSACSDIEDYLRHQGLDSENVVFVKN
jgi:FkbM family methyltransferase